MENNLWQPQGKTWMEKLDYQDCVIELDSSRLL